MRIIHFSDIHAGGWIDDRNGYFDKRLLGALNFMTRRKLFHTWEFVDLAVNRIKELSPDIVVCTGDLATISERREFMQSMEALAPLVDDHRFKLVYVPGNHDAYIQDNKCQLYLEKAFKYLNRNQFELKDLPCFFDLENWRFLLVNQACPVPFYSSSGSLNERSQKWVKEYFSRESEERKKNILIGHFPLFDSNGNPLSYRRRCYHNDLLQEAFLRGDITISLCGHIHHEFVRWTQNDSVEICAGSLTKNGLINLIDCSHKTNTIKQEWIDITACDRRSS